ncbi:MAG TPA: methyltransferase domain-containing protein [Candidatus Aquilonibacter sp.]
MADATALREALVAHLEATRVVRTPAVASAMRAVARDRFTPNTSLEDAYDDKALSLKEMGGITISSISQPSMIAQMLELLDVREGNHVLEIGTGSGYNAALLATLAGAHGSVTSVELERDLLEQARAALDREAFERVILLHADALAGCTRTFDRIVVTARANDITAQWWRLLADGGRLVVPLDIGYGGERAVGFLRRGARLESFGSYACAFVALREHETQIPPGIFFRSAFERYRREPTPTLPLRIVAVQSVDALPSLLQESDTVVAREHTLFSLRRSLQV